MPETVEGLGDFQRDLAESVPALDAEIRKLNTQLSARIVTDARARASTPMASRAASAGLSVIGGEVGGVSFRATPDTPYAMGSEFGANRNAIRTRRGEHGRSYVGYRQFEPHAGSQGYWLWPAIRDAKVLKAYDDALGTMMDSLGGDA